MKKSEMFWGKKYQRQLNTGLGIHKLASESYNMINVQLHAHSNFTFTYYKMPTPTKK